jgi:hypothetical protein
MNPGIPVLATVSRRAQGVTPPSALGCFFGPLNGAGTACTPTALPAGALPLKSTNTVSASVLPGYYTFAATAFDAAGNSTVLTPIVALYDGTGAVAPTAPVVSSAVYAVPLNLAVASFTANASDNLDIRDYQWTFTYGATMAGDPIQTNATVVNTYNAATFINTNVGLPFSSNTLIRTISEDGSTAWAPGAATVLSSANVIVRDQGSQSTTSSTAIPAGTVNLTTLPVTAWGALPGGTPTGWSISNAATNVSDGNTPPASVNPLSVTLNADLTGATGVFNTPFSRVDFYAFNAVSAQWVLIGSQAAVVTTDNGAVRQHRYSISWTPGTTFGLGAINLRALGVAATGDAEATVTSANITVTHP